MLALGDPIDLAEVTIYGTRTFNTAPVSLPRIPWEVGLRFAGNTLKALATVPLMTLAFVLSPTQLGPASRPNVMSEGKFKGGKQGQRDNDYGYFKDKAFKDWWHRSGKKKWGGQDFNEGNAEEIYQEWLDLGKPRGGGNKTKHK
ncbi:MAG: hypothetical protein EAZ70_04795 [Runella slithyformis]|nr:MAG: hypothetical protein EAY79_05155 [Runella slithyformis]TAF28670.1 MAG: hypothetical protein EAZ70_04795 [Runella slithyformis]TAF82387.1 MAG: hypothetical protein EAZ50_04300 [Runella slithyformis]